MILNGHGFSLRLIMAEGRSADRFVGHAIIAIGDPELESASSLRVDFPTADLIRLCDWIDQHLREQARGDSRPARRVWVPADLSLQLELLDGEIETHANGTLEGNITVTVFVNLGPTRPSGFSLYQGVQGVVSAKDLLGFRGAVLEAV